MIIFLVVSLVINLAAGEDFLRNLNLVRCNKISTPEFNRCFVKSINDAVPIFRNGFPSLGLPPLEPIKITNFTSQQKEFQMTINDCEVHGLGNNLKFFNATYDAKNKTLDLYGFASLVTINGEYTVAGSMLSMAVNGSGKFNILAEQLLARHYPKRAEIEWKRLGMNDNYFMQPHSMVYVVSEITISNNYENDDVDTENVFGNITTELRMSFEIKDSNGTDAIALTKCDYLNKDVGDADLFFESIINGNQTQSDAVSDMLNENWQQMDALVQVFDEALSDFFERYFTKAFGYVKYDEVFPNT